MGERELEKRKIPYINVRILSIILVSMGLLCFSLTLIYSFLSSERYNKVITESQRYLNAESNIHEMRSGIDYLNDQAKRAVNTTRSQYILSYFVEDNGTKRISDAYAELDVLLASDYTDALTRLTSAYAKSDALSARQIHALKLVAVAAEVPGSKLPNQVKEYKLPEDEEAMTAFEKEKAADKLIDSDEYMALKASIDNDLDQALEIIKDEMVESLEESKNKFRFSVEMQRVFLFLSFLVLLGIGAGLFLLLLMPIGRNISAIKHDEKMPDCISYEMQYMVTEYNALYEKNVNDKIGLKKKAEHDGLTGLLNRTAFNSICDNLRDISRKVGLIIIDVDDFKNINDDAGHETGDNALIHVANVLSETFREEDYIVRYGGDEFVVLMEDVTYAERDALLRKLKRINSILGDPKESGIPQLSISAGVAFSANGFNSRLFESADAALYKVKANGKHGYLFAKS